MVILSSLLKRKSDIIAVILGIASLLTGMWIYPVNHYTTAVILMVAAIALYFYIAMIPARKNWWDIRAVFSMIWIFTVGLSAMWLTDYQKPWQQETWLCMTIAYGMFYMGALFGEKIGVKINSFFRSKKGLVKGRLVFGLREERLFWICFGVTIMGIVCFAANIAIKGYIPFWVQGNDTYVKFYTKFHIFSVAATMISGLSYYTLKTQNLSKWKKIFLWFSIVYSTFIYPTFVVSRGTFLTSALLLTTAIFYLNKKRFIALALCAVVILVFYAVGTKSRGYSNDQLDTFFEPSDIEIQKPGGDSDTPGNTNTFRLSGTAAFIYSYLTVSHDNFNEAVLNIENHTNGIRQLSPFNVILRIGPLETALEDVEEFRIRPWFNTVNIAGYAYYDFGIAGVAIFMFIWAVIYSAVQACYLSGEKPFAMMALGNTMTPVAMCFFSAWMSIFAFWMHWGFALILCLIACITIKPKIK